MLRRVRGRFAHGPSARRCGVSDGRLPARRWPFSLRCPSPRILRNPPLLSSSPKAKSLLFSESPKQKLSPFAALEADYVRTFLNRFPVVATYLGAAGLDPAYAALDGKLRDYSPSALLAERDEWRGFEARLAKIDAKKLSEPERIDAAVMKAQLAFLIHNHERRIHEKALDVFLEEPLRGIEWTLQGMEPGAGGARGTKAEWEAIASRAAAVPAYLKTALANARRGASGDAIPDRRLVAVVRRGGRSRPPSTSRRRSPSGPKEAGAALDDAGRAAFLVGVLGRRPPRSATSARASSSSTTSPTERR